MKKLVVYGFMVMTIVAGFADYYKRATEGKAEIREKQILKWELQGLKRLKVLRGSESWTYEKRGEIWWITEPVLYPVRRESFEGHFQMMTRVLADEAFQNTEGKDYGFGTPQGQIEVTAADGEIKTFTISGKTAGTRQVYVREDDKPTIYVIHGAWAQFLNQPWHIMYSDLLWPGAEDVMALSWGKGPDRVWKLIRSKDGKWEIVEGDKRQALSDKKAGEIRGSWNQVQVKSVQVPVPEVNFVPEWTLTITTHTGDHRVLLDGPMQRVYLEHYKATGVVDPQALEATLKIIRESWKP